MAGLIVLISLCITQGVIVSHAEYNYDNFGVNLFDYDKYNVYNTRDYQTDMDLAALGDLLQRLAAVDSDAEVTPAPSRYPMPMPDSSRPGYPMSQSARMLGYGFPQHSSGYDMSQGYGHQSGYGHQQQQSYHQPSYQQQSYQPVQKGYQQQQAYHQQQPSYKPEKGYHDDGGYGMADKGYAYGYKKPKKQKIFVPIVIKKKKKKKRKTIAVYKGFYVEGGTQIFGKFKKMKDCKKACEITPTCFAADYNPWLKKCYIHTNVTACEEMRTHPKLIHFKKVPCDLVETPRGLITLGTQLFGGLEQKGVKNLQDCIKKCASAGSGIAPDSSAEELARQICFGIDYDFGTHKCYFHTDETLCPAEDPIPTPVNLIAAPSVINILLCPISSMT